MLGKLSGGRLDIYWREDGQIRAKLASVKGDPRTLAKALSRAREVGDLISEAGGWTEALSLGINAHKPGNSLEVAPEILGQDQLNSGLAQLQIPRSAHGPGPVGIFVRSWRIRLVGTHYEIDG